jgi:hypothetical protein
MKESVNTRHTVQMAADCIIQDPVPAQHIQPWFAPDLMLTDRIQHPALSPVAARTDGM